MQRDDGWADDTWLVAGGRPHAAGEPLNEPIVAASNFEHGDADEEPGRIYSRGDGTAGWASLEAVVGGLEGAECISFASGMAAIAAVFAGVPSGGHVVIPADCYQATEGVAAAGEADGRWTITRVDTDDTDGWLAAVGAADLIWVESPSNPLMLVADLHRIAAESRGPGTVLAVDNTFATALNQRPLDLGADLSVQSATKFIGGHSDLLAGVVTTRRPELADALRRQRLLHGATPGALETFLATRGVRTMALRLERGQASARTIAERLADHPAVTRVRYPGLPDDPGHALAAAQMSGFGSVLSFELADAEAARAACRRIRLIRHATSLGGVESTMEQRAALDGQEDVPPGLIRLSVGIESVDDLWLDLDQAISQPH